MELISVMTVSKSQKLRGLLASGKVLGGTETLKQLAWVISIRKPKLRCTAFESVSVPDECPVGGPGHRRFPSLRGAAVDSRF